MGIVLAIILLIIAIFVIPAIKDFNLERKCRNGTATEEELQMYNAILLNKEAHKQKTSIKKVIILSNSSQKKVGSAVIRGAVGGALLGPVGLVGGAISGKNKNQTTFLIEFADGHKETKIVDNNSPEFEKLCKYIEM